jgi:ABC-type uncharacterized transport system substrate-binding protein
MDRRQIIFVGVGALAVPLASLAQAQTPKSRRLVAFLDGKSQSAGQPLITVFRQELQSLGYDESRNVEFAYRFADSRDERLPSLAQELIALKPSVIVAPGVNAAVAARNVTKTVPIVSWALADAVNLGLVASYARPGGNVTGIMPYVEGLPAKQIEIARQVLPSARKIGLLGNLNDPKAPPQQKELENAARLLKMPVVMPEVKSPDELDGALRRLATERADIVIVLETAMTLSERDRIAASAMANRLPTVFGYRENVAAGGLVSYGVDLRWCSRRAAAFVQKILNGASPDYLPVEFPTSLQLAINLKTAKALGVTIPRELLNRADEVIE